MGTKVDILGYEYDDAEPAFTAVGSGYYYHLRTKRMYERSSFDLREGTFQEGELGTPSAGYIAEHGIMLQGLYEPLVPTVPNTFVATADGSDTINMTWVDTSGNEAGFRLEVSDAVDGTFVTIADLEPGTEAYSHTGLDAATAYFYELFSFNVTGDSATAATATATTSA